MAYVGGTPNIILTGDRDKALELLPQGRAFYWRIRDVIANAGVSTYQSSVALNDLGAFASVGFAGTTSFIEIVSPIEEPTSESGEPETLDVPQYFAPKYNSGYVSGGNYVKREEGPDQVSSLFRTLANRVARGKPSYPNGEVTEDLDVRPGMGLPRSDPEGTVEYSQYRHISPSRYSGEMRKVVQAFLGFGRQSGSYTHVGDPEDDPNYPPWAFSDGFQVRYDYRHGCTHGVLTDDNGLKWLIEVSISRGVLAMRLPTLNIEVEEGSELYEIREELGYIPSGGVIPVELDGLLEAGRVVRLMEASELAPYYSEYAPFTTEWGWAFSDTGRDAVLTGYKVRADGHQESVLYMLELDVSETPEGVAVGAARLVLGKSGYIWAPPTKFGKFLPIKYPAGFGSNVIINHDGAPSGGASMEQLETCDAPIFAAYIDGTLQVVNYSRPKNSGGPSADASWDDREGEPCLLSGSWTWGVSYGPHESTAHVYTSTHDDRQILASGERHSILVSTDMGYDPPHFTDIMGCPWAAFAWRNRRWRQLSKTWFTAGERDGAVVAIPVGERCGYAYAYVRTTPNGVEYSESMSYTLIRDPWTGWAVRCLGGPWSCAPWPSHMSEEACGLNCSPFAFGPQYHPDRRIIGADYSPSSGCGDYADNGNWLPQCTSIDGWTESRDVPEPYSISPVRSDPDFTGFGYCVTMSGESERFEVSQNAWAANWNQPSPHPDGGDMQFMVAASNCLGSPSTKMPQGPFGALNTVGETQLNGAFGRIQTSSIGYVL